MLTIQLNIESKLPMYEQIYKSVKSQIKNGTLSPNTKLPSTRILAENLGISRNTVDLAYSQLVSEGYIESKPKSGYYVSFVSELTSIETKVETAIPRSKEIKNYFQYDFSPFTIDLNSFPYNTWRKLSKEAMNEYNNHLFLLGDNQGDPSLRSAICEYLKSFRNVNCNMEQIIVGAGADYLLQLLCQILSRQNYAGCIAMENPTKASL